MKIEKVSAVAELVSAIAIVVTLGYLALETRQNTIAVQAGVRQAMLSEDRELLFQQMEYPFVSPYVYGTKQLSDDEKTQLASWLIALLRSRESHWLQYQAGVIDESTWEVYRSPLRSVLLIEPAKTFWRIRSKRGEFTQGFIEDVDDYLASAPLKSESSLDQKLGFKD